MSEKNEAVVSIWLKRRVSRGEEATFVSVTHQLSDESNHHRTLFPLKSDDAKIIFADGTKVVFKKNIYAEYDVSVKKLGSGSVFSRHDYTTYYDKGVSSSCEFSLKVTNPKFTRPIERITDFATVAPC